MFFCRRKLTPWQNFMAADGVVTSTVDMPLRSITKLSWPKCVVEKLDSGDFSGKTEGTPLLTVSSRSDFKIIQSRNDETQNNESTDSVACLALRPIYDQQADIHYSLLVFWINWKQGFRFRERKLKRFFPGWKKLRKFRDYSLLLPSPSKKRHGSHPNNS